MTKTATLEAKIRNEERRFRRLKASGDWSRLERMRQKLPQLQGEIESHNRLMREILFAKASAEALQQLIDRPRLCLRKSYRFEWWLEDLAIVQL